MLFLVRGRLSGSGVGTGGQFIDKERDNRIYIFFSFMELHLIVYHLKNLLLCPMRMCGCWDRNTHQHHAGRHPNRKHSLRDRADIPPIWQLFHSNPSNRNSRNLSPESLQTPALQAYPRLYRHHCMNKTNRSSLSRTGRDTTILAVR